MGRNNRLAPAAGLSLARRSAFAPTHRPPTTQLTRLDDPAPLRPALCGAERRSLRQAIGNNAERQQSDVDRVPSRQGDGDDHLEWYEG